MALNLEDEVREGYMVSSKMKKAWKAELDMLIKLEEFCDENGLIYFMDYGTLLGAVRHKGFIPWDDDIDVTMPRPDYQRFLELAPSWFKHPYFVQNYYTDHHDNRMTMFSRIRNDNTTMLEKNYVPYADYHQGIFIDVFPMDIAPDDLGEREMSDAIATVLELWDATFDSKSLIMDLIAGKETKAGLDTLIDVLGLPYEERLKLLEGILTSLYDSAEEINVFSEIFRTPSCKKEWYSKTIKLPFEDYEFNAPSKYHEILTAHYGDYMVPKMFMADHEVGLLDPDRPYTEYIN